MHLHVWSYKGQQLDAPVAEAELVPNDIYCDPAKPDPGDHIQWIGTIVIDGTEYHLELRQPVHLG